MAAKIFIGTSGWFYKHWLNGAFYPADLGAGRELEYYATKFSTVEINSSFYHNPREKTYKNWHRRTPRDFTFSLKGSRFISHILKLNTALEPLQDLIAGASLLEEKLGPILFQLPPNFEYNFDRLEKFTSLLPRDKRFTFEFRHQSWFTAKVYSLFSKNNIALTISDTPSYPLVVKSTADFVYIRLHGRERLYASRYTDEQLKEWAARIKRWLSLGKDVYCYFDNDAQAFAPKNALELKAHLG